VCRFRSAEAIFQPDSNGVKLVFTKGEDSHTKNRANNGITEVTDEYTQKHTPLEYIPTTSLKDFSTYRFVFDAGRPDWWTDEMTDSAIRQFQEEIGRCDYADWGGNLDLGNLTTLDQPLTVGGDLDLDSLTKLDQPLTVGGSLDLDSLTKLDQPLTVGGSLDLNSLTKLDQPLTVGGSLYLRSLTKLDQPLTVGGSLDLNSLTKLPDSVAISANDIFYNGKWQAGYPVR
jgi:hypothetical protein